MIGIRIRKKKLEDVFTPSNAAVLNYIKRPSLEDILSKNLTIQGKQIILYGHSGSGKTTLIREALSKLKKNYIITTCISSDTLEDIIIKAFDKLNPYYMAKTSKKRSIKISEQLKLKYTGIDNTLKTEVHRENTEEQQRVLPVQLTYEKLAEFLGAANCVWVIDDFHKVEDYEKQKLAEVMKAFVDISNDYNKVKIVALGAVSSGREIINNTNDIQGRLAEIAVPLLSNDQIKEILENGEKLLNIRFSDNLKDLTCKYANSLGSICHALAYNYCHISGIHKTPFFEITISDDIVNKAIEEYVSEKSDTYKQLLDKALKSRGNSYENVKLILQAIISLNMEDVTHNEILTKIQESTPSYPQGNCTNYLQKLCSNKFDEILRYDNNSGKYSFSDLFFKSYCRIMFDLDIPNGDSDIVYNMLQEQIASN